VLFANYNLYDEVEEDEMAKTCSTKWEKLNSYRLLVGKSQGERPMRRPILKWFYNNKTDLGVIKFNDVTVLVCLRIWTSGKLL
jgi:hypothetical protein